MTNASEQDLSETLGLKRKLATKILLLDFKALTSNPDSGLTQKERRQILKRLGALSREERERLRQKLERLQDEIGDLLFAVVNLGRHLGVDPERALRGTNAKFERRFRAVEATLGDRLGSADLEEMEAAWVAAKLREKGAVTD